VREPELHLRAVHLWARLHMWRAKFRVHQREVHVFAVHLRSRLQLQFLTDSGLSSR